ncbi:hypothetical protein GCM10011352_04380 [Marinobacterium zhoushanense]|uniref:2-methylcitrate dehydratase PrpD n=1 Tax=Marinobacterium zhoushanense TaxID=1679163 RepID=A0ABQ1K340_9GAMM|nr:MmgE/PrpD family protein [Marinobacterium zhoushanense]GGB81738.1 hypothetical protein GCM10011352_04380 [Marinobacterium zhoushanense]
MKTSTLTLEASKFAANLTFDMITDEALRIARRCIIDGLGVMLGGSDQEIATVTKKYINSVKGPAQARTIGNDKVRVSAPQAAFFNGIVGHAMDWDDTQLAESPGRQYGLLTHPTIPPLAAALAISDMLGDVTGEQFVTAFIAGFEVECKIAEAINPDHYKHGFHTSGTIGTFGAAVAAAKLLGLDEAGIARAIGGAASMASGIRANFGTMGKPMHVGRAAENGVTSALLSQLGFTFNTEALDGPWGYLSVAGRGGEPEYVSGRFGAPFSIAEPGVSIKPYPCGVLTHPSMDALKFLLEENNLQPSDIESVTLHAASNILNPIRFRTAKTELEGKFCMAFLLAAIILRRQAGKKEFTDEFVNSAESQKMQQRINTNLDPEIEAMGYDQIRSRVEVITKDGKIFEKWANEAYRGGPNNPMSPSELEDKFLDCAEGVIDPIQAKTILDMVWEIEHIENITTLIDILG